MVNKMIMKKNGTLLPYDFQYIRDAVEASACFARPVFYQKGEIQTNVYPSGTHLSDDEWSLLQTLVESALQNLDEPIPTKVMHQIVIDSLEKVDAKIRDAYRSYHVDKKQFYESLDTAMEEREQNLSVGNVSNANALSSLASTQKVLSADVFEKQLNLSLLMTPADRLAHTEGYIYWHDLCNLSVFPYNCCLFRAGEVIKKEWEINGIHIMPPTDLRSAFSNLLRAMFIVASNQYGGLTVPRIDSILAPYAKMEYEKQLSYFLSLGIKANNAKEYALDKTYEVMKEGFHELELKCGTDGSARGDYPFISISGGCDTDQFAVALWKAALETRMEGIGPEGKKKPALFPKLIFLYDKELHGEGKVLYELYEKGVQCSSKVMYPDWLSLTGDGYVPSMYKKYKSVSPDHAIVSPMGCRAFLSPWYVRGGMFPADDNDYPVFEGRFNIGVISLNLPLIYGEALNQQADFFKLLDYYLELIRNAFKRRYQKIASKKASCNPLMFCYGGALGGNLNPDDEIRPLLKSATASFGITALNELQEFYNGKSLAEDGAFALEVLEYINSRVEQFKKEDGHLYAIYGTPAESLCGRQAKQLRDKFGIIKGVSDREYVSNSFHCHVTEKISPIQKQDLEYRFWNLCNGGKIQYCKYPLTYNETAIRTLLSRAMEMGFYEGINLDLDFCEDCGASHVEMKVTCPCCGSRNIFSIERMNGYLGQSRTKYGSRFNHAKMVEIAERVSM